MPNDVPDWTGQQRVNIRGEVSGAPLGDTGAAALSADSGTEQISTGGGPVVGSDSVGVLASFTPAAGSAIAQRGALGAFTQAGVLSVSPPWGQAVLAGSLGVAWVTCFNANPATVTAGWVLDLVKTTSGFTRVAIFHKPNLGAGEAPPVFTAVGGTAPMIAQLGEFTGAATVAPTERTGSASTTQTTITVPASAPDAAGGDLVLLAVLWRITNPFPATFTDSFDNGAVAVHAGDDGGLNSTNHTSFSYAIMPAATTVLPLGVSDWPYDVSATSAPAVGVQATVTLAATPGKRWITAHLGAGTNASTATATNTDVILKDGANAIWTEMLSSQAAIGSQDKINLRGLGYRGTVGNAMTFGFTAAQGSQFQRVNVGVYLR